MRVLIRTTPWHAERYAWAEDLASKTGGVLVPDNRPLEERNREPTGFSTFVKALERVQWPGAWIIEDDAQLTARFPQLALWHQRNHPGAILQAWSTSKDEVERWRSGRTFGSTLCVYFPADKAASLRDFAEYWTKPEDRPHRESDIMVRDFLTFSCVRYWNIVPCLASHRANYSVRTKRRYAERRPRSFVP